LARKIWTNMCQIWHQHRATWKSIESSHMDGWLCPCICAIEATQRFSLCIWLTLRSFKIGFHTVPITDVQTLHCQMFINLNKWSSTVSKLKISEFQQLRNKYAKYILCCAFVIVTRWFSIFNNCFLVSSA
jgi:hypothetical protein